MRLICRLFRRHWWVYYGHDVSACRCLVCNTWRPDCMTDHTRATKETR